MYGMKRDLSEEDVEQLVQYSREKLKKMERGMILVKGRVYQPSDKSLTEDDEDLFDEWYKKIKEGERKREENILEDELLRLVS